MRKVAHPLEASAVAGLLALAAIAPFGCGDSGSAAGSWGPDSGVDGPSGSSGGTSGSGTGTSSSGGSGGARPDASASGSSGGSSGSSGSGGSASSSGSSGSSGQGSSGSIDASSSGTPDDGGFGDDGAPLDASTVSDGAAGACAAGADPLKTGDMGKDAYDCTLIALAQMYGDPDPMMAKAQIQIESGFNVLATSPDSPCGDPNGWSDGESKSFGLIQVTPACGEENAALLPNGHPNLDMDMSSALWATSVYNPAINLDAGIQSIAGSLKTAERNFPGCTMAQYVEMSAGAFNSGDNAVTGCAMFNSRAQGYVNAAITNYHQFAQAAGWPDPY